MHLYVDSDVLISACVDFSMISCNVSFGGCLGGLGSFSCLGASRIWLEFVFEYEEPDLCCFCVCW